MLARALLLCSLLVALLIPASASAGGVGFFNGTGVHSGGALSQAGGRGTWVNEGGGVEIFLGKRDFRLHGRLRFGYNAVLDVTPLAEGAVAKNRVTHAGVISLGAKVELLPDIEKAFGLYVVADIGVAPLVKYGRGYLFVDVGPGARVNVNQVFQLFAELTGMLRYENGFTGGALLFLGARFSFD